MRKHNLIILAILGLSGCQLIQDQFDGNQPPAIGEFSAEPAEGEAPLLVGFGWDVVDLEGDMLACTLEFGDGAKETVENCADVTDTFHTFEEPGGYTVVVRIADGLNTVAASVPVRVLEPETEESSKKRQ